MTNEAQRVPLPEWPHEELLYETIDDGQIAIITMNRPERMNASDPGMAQRWVDAWTTFADDERCRVAIVTGAGDRAFSAGQDLKIRAELEEQGGDAPYRNRVRRVTPIGEKLGCWKPTIAAINGYAIAGGWSVAQYCTFRIAAEHAEMGFHVVGFLGPSATSFVASTGVSSRRSRGSWAWARPSSSASWVTGASARSARTRWDSSIRSCRRRS